MNIQQTLFKLGIPTYCYSVETDITANNSIKIGETLPQDLGWIYGLSTNATGVTARDQTKLLPSFAQLSNLYLNLKYGQSIFVNGLRLCDLLFLDPASGIPINSSRYLEVNVPLNTDLKLSFIDNPTLITGVTCVLNLYYIDKISYSTLVKQGLVLQNGLKQV